MIRCVGVGPGHLGFLTRIGEAVNDTDVSARCGSPSFFDASAKSEGSAITKRSRDTGTLAAGPRKLPGREATVTKLSK